MPNAEEVRTQEKKLELDKKQLHELMGFNFLIPYYQRGYRWNSDNITTLLDDLLVFIKDKDNENNAYFMQPLTISKTINAEPYTYIVIDGQQRLTTYYILHNYLKCKLNREEKNKWYTFTYAKDKDLKDDKISDLLDNIIIFKNDDTGKNIKDINKYYICNAYTSIEKWFSDRKDDNNILKELFYSLMIGPMENKSIYFLWYEVPSDKDGHSIFQNLNSNKIQLTNADLIKALLLSESLGLDNRYQVAAQFEEMERKFNDGKFWFMLSNKDVRSDKGQSRIDLLFNYSLKINTISDPKYVNDSRITFNSMMKMDKDELAKNWKEIRQNFQVLLDFFNNVEYSHYLGYLNFASNKGINMHDYIKDYLSKSKTDFLNELKQDIAKTLKFQNIDDYNYNVGNKELQKLFVLHNIQTIISRYKHLKKSVKYYYEYFPFELLYPLSHWNIEHIDSQTNNNLDDLNDREDWLYTMFNDYSDNPAIIELKQNSFKEIMKDLSPNQTVSEDDYSDKSLIDLLCTDKSCSYFGQFREKLEIAVKSIENDNPENNAINNNKDEIGNLVLLDSHINQSFHNAVFARKRRIVLMSSGLINQDEAKEYGMRKEDYTYIPICTRDVYTKAYNKCNKLKFNCWTQRDFDSYKSDIEDKLNDFFEIKTNN